MSRKIFDNETQKLIGRRIKDIRGKLSQQDFADQLGIGRTSLANYEGGRRLPNDKVLKKIAIIGKTTVDSILRTNDIDFSMPTELEEWEEKIRDHLKNCQQLKVIPASTISDDEMSILRVLRSISQNGSIEILKEIIQIFENESAIAANQQTLLDSKKIKMMINKGTFSHGIDIENLLWGFEQLRKSTKKLNKEND